MKDEMTEFWDWFNVGVHKGWVTTPFCQTHDGGYDVMTQEEIEEWEDGGDPCMTVSRVKFLG